MSSVSLFFLFSGSLFSCILSAALLCTRGRQPVHNLTAALLAAVGFWQLQMALYAGNYYIVFPHLLLSHIPVLFLTGPLLYEFMSSLVDPGQHRTVRRLWHLAPAVVSALLLVPFYIRSGPGKIVLFQSGFGLSAEPYLPSIIPALLHLALISLGIYLVMVLKKSFFLIPAKTGRRTPNATLVFSVAMALCALTVLALAGQLLDPALKTASVLGVNAVILFLFLYSQRNPRFLQNLRREIREKRYAVSRIGSLDVSALVGRMERMMHDDKLYRIEGFGLNDFAQRLGIYPQQLSEILNNVLHTPFTMYVNSVRIAEAQRLLIETDTSVLSIAFETGFNTKSSFYEWFQKVMKYTPSEFREKNRVIP